MFSRRPWAFIIGSVVFCVICVAGLTKLYEETDGQKLWMAQGTEFADRMLGSSADNELNVKKQYPAVYQWARNISETYGRFDLE